ncbi:MAG TPA: hypothetical protein VLA89_05800 [Gemmatimonadales bacterium]|nr:hypothetical protein [Gemmatimonadales bacterium]
MMNAVAQLGSAAHLAAALQIATDPRTLGWLLIFGGASYLLSVFVNYLAPDSGVVVGLLTVPPRSLSSR